MYKIKISSLFLTLMFGMLITSCGSRKSNKMTDTEKEFVIAQQYSDVADTYLRYLNEKNVDGILSLYADNATVEDPVGSAIVAGKVALREFYSNAVNTDLVLTRTGQVRVAGAEIAFPFQLRMTVDGVPMVTDIIDVFRFDDTGKIVSMRAFWGPFNQKTAIE